MMLTVSHPSVPVMRKPSDAGRDCVGEAKVISRVPVELAAVRRIAWIVSCGARVSLLREANAERWVIGEGRRTRSAAVVC